MRIVLLCRNMHTAGGYVVGINFVRTLKKVAPNHKFLLVAPPDVGYEDVQLPEGSKIVLYRGGLNTFNQWKFDYFHLPRIIKGFNPDLIFAMGNFGVKLAGYKQAVLFHKPQLVYPSKHYYREVRKAKIRNRLLKRRLKQCLKYTELVFCQTPVARKRFAETFRYSEERIKIMPNAVSEIAKTSRQAAGRPEKLQKPGYFNLFLLTKFYAHKNLEILVDIFRNYRERLKDVRCIVTVTAHQHPNAPKFLSDINKYNLQEHIINVGPLKQDELAAYFYNCDALFFPTMLESFSGTYLEAMHFELPILTSDLDFARFVCGDAALYFDPWKPADVVDKILTLKNDVGLRRELTEKGRKRVSSLFKSWEEIAEQTIRELETMVKKV